MLFPGCRPSALGGFLSWVSSAYTRSLWDRGTGRVAGAASCWVAPGQAENLPPELALSRPISTWMSGQAVPEATLSGVTFKFSAPPSSRPRLACSLGSSQTAPLPPSGPDSSGWLAWVPRLIQTSSWLFINSIRPYQPHHQEEGQEGLVTEAGGRQALISLPALRGHSQFSHSGFTWPGSRRIVGITGDRPLPPAHRAPTLHLSSGPESCEWKSLVLIPSDWHFCESRFVTSSQFMGTPLIHGCLYQLQSLDPDLVPWSSPTLQRASKHLLLECRVLQPVFPSQLQDNHLKRAVGSGRAHGDPGSHHHSAVNLGSFLVIKKKSEDDNTFPLLGALIQNTCKYASKF